MTAGMDGQGSWTRARRSVPATQDLEATLGLLVAFAAAGTLIAAIVPIGRASLVAAVAVVALVISAVTLLHVVLVLSPPILRRPPGGGVRPVRAAVIGSVASARDVRSELQCAGVDAIVIAGAIAPEPVPDRPVDELELGPLAELGALVESQQIDLVVLDSNVSRSEVVGVVFDTCEGNPVRLCDLSAFYEDVFGRVPVTEIDRAWCQYVLHPRFRERRSQRVFDVVVAATLALLLAPVLAGAALLVRRDGGPVLYRQRRIGQYGRPFVIYKLRTMRWEGEGESPRWTVDGDPRITSVGRALRRIHLDELPQLINVMRGDMTLVGPRPEQPEIAAQLEAAIPFWRARYRHKPGLTGWAQIRCGYAGSLDGSASKLAHDLYYLRHRSLALDFAILVQTAFTLLFAHQVDNPESRFVRAASPLPDTAPAEAIGGGDRSWALQDPVIVPGAAGDGGA